MLELIEGRVISFRPISKSNVQLEISEFRPAVELHLDESWAIKRGDNVRLIGSLDHSNENS